MKLSLNQNNTLKNCLLYRLTSFTRYTCLPLTEQESDQTKKRL